MFVTLQTLNRRSQGIAVVWIVLIATIALSLVLRSDDGSSARGASIVTVAFVKVWLIGNYFMELNRAPRLLRFGFAAYVVVTCTTLICTFYR